MVRALSPPRLRRPAVAGYYYPEDPQELRGELDRLLQVSDHSQRMAARGIIIPHGALRQSGAVAGAVVGRIRVPRCCVIIGPSHTGSAMRWSVLARGGYRTPLGTVAVDEPLCSMLLERCPSLEADPWGQRGEHAIEVVLPFLQSIRPTGLSLVPVVMNSDRTEDAAELAQGLAHLIRIHEEPLLLIGSSDLSHYEDAEAGAEKDRRLIELIVSLDGPGLLRTVQAGGAMMCGGGPVACVLMAAARLGAIRGELISYGTSLAAGGDPHSVVGYAGIIVH